MALEKAKFMSDYRISEEQFEKTGLDWNELEQIHDDFQGKSDNYSQAAKFIAEGIRMAPNVHSIRYRVKKPEHLIEKIIRKKIKDPGRTITLNNYVTEITDLIGIRALHLFKDDWFPIHDYITKHWALHESPTTYIREGDNVPDLYRENSNVKPHEFGYRSVHYLIKTSPFREVIITEIQVRTIFEEGWSEIDHTIRYPYDIDNRIFNPFLQIFNRLAGSADEMGTYINFLKKELELKDRQHNEELGEKNKIITSLENKISDIGELSKVEKDKLLEEIKTLKQKVNSPSLTFDLTRPIILGDDHRGEITLTNPGQGKWIVSSTNGSPGTLYSMDGALTSFSSTLTPVTGPVTLMSGNIKDPSNSILAGQNGIIINGDGSRVKEKK